MKEQRKQDVLSASILLKQKRDIKGGRPLLPPQYAGMAELADAQDLGSCGEIRVGSTPTIRTIKKRLV